MNFQSLSRCPIAYDPSAGAEAARLVCDLSPQTRALLQGAAGCAPYLATLIRHEALWLSPVLQADPGDTLAAVLAAIPVSPDPLGVALRQAKRRIALLAALTDLGGIWTLEQVTAALTRLADACVSHAVTALVAEEIRRGKLPGATADDAPTGAGMVVLAMGKMGAGELNFSSDIDLICLYDETQYPGETEAARAAFIRVTRRLTALLSDQTDQGYVFRTDLRLRPDAAVTPVCLSMAAAEAYYESVGRTWERAAYIKARPCAGDVAAGARFLQTLTPFVWRKHLDFAAIQDAHDMRLRIRDHRGFHGAIRLPGHNMKLGQGGIREIEFFTQTRQIIAGGRDPDLRSRQTLSALAALAGKGWIPGEVAEEMSHLYRAHREVEHRLQMVNDAQTHDLPTTPEGFDRLARLMGQGDTGALCTQLLNRLTVAATLTDSFFSPSAATEGPALSETARTVVDGWRAYPALRSPRAVEIFKRVRPRLLRQLGQSANPDAALLQFDSFLKGLPGGVQVFSLFDANPQLIDLIVDIAATAPNLARYLARNSAVLDAVIGGGFFAPWPGSRALHQMLSGQISQIAGYEAKLDGARLWAKEWHFRIGVHHLRGLIDGFEAASQYADLAAAVLAAIWPECCLEFARKHGPPPGRGAVVLGMGSLGAARLNARSDLDLIVIYDPGTDEQSIGPRPLAARPYFARLTQALVTALAAPMAQGKLYDVDMRLRPSGRQGPVATALDAFRTYQQTEAWTWEHLALTRARVLAGAPNLAAEVEAFRLAVLIQKGSGAAVTADVAEMRARVRLARPADGIWDVKQALGGLMDIELVAQTAALKAADASCGVEQQLAAGVRVGWLTDLQQGVLLAAYRICWRVHAVARLLGDSNLDPGQIGAAGAAFVLRETGAATIEALAQQLVTACARANAVVAALLPKEAGNGA